MHYRTEQSTYAFPELKPKREDFVASRSKTFKFSVSYVAKTLVTYGHRIETLRNFRG